MRPTLERAYSASPMDLTRIEAIIDPNEGNRVQRTLQVLNARGTTYAEVLICGEGDPNKKGNECFRGMHECHVHAVAAWQVICYVTNDTVADAVQLLSSCAPKKAGKGYVATSNTKFIPTFPVQEPKNTEVQRKTA